MCNFWDLRASESPSVSPGFGRAYFENILYQIYVLIVSGGFRSVMVSCLYMLWCSKLFLINRLLRPLFWQMTWFFSFENVMYENFKWIFVNVQFSLFSFVFWKWFAWVFFCTLDAYHVINQGNDKKLWKFSTSNSINSWWIV